MSTDSTDLDTLKQRAEEIGLTKLTYAHLEQLARATRSAQQRKEQLRLDLVMADEPAHVFRLDEE